MPMTPDRKKKGRYIERPQPVSLSNAGAVAAAKANRLEDGKKLCNEIAGMIGAPELRTLIGNTNFECLLLRWENMRAAIKKAESGE